MPKRLPDIKLQPGQEVYVFAPQGEKVTAYYDSNVTRKRARVAASGDYVETPPVDPPSSGVTVDVPKGFGVTAMSDVKESDLTVYHVTNLNPRGPGSLLAAMRHPMAKVVFDVAGTIRTESDFELRGDEGYHHLVIAGETAPAPGISLLGYPLGLKYGFHDWDFRHLRHLGQGGLVLGQDSGCFKHDGRPATPVSRGLYRNCSASGWSYGGEGFTSWNNVREITVMDCMSGGGDIAGDGVHDYTYATGKQVSGITFYRSLAFGATYRQPSFGWYDDPAVDGTTPPPGVVSGEAVDMIVWDVARHIVEAGGDDHGYGAVVYYGARANLRGGLYSSRYVGPDYMLDYSGTSGVSRAYREGVKFLDLKTGRMTDLGPANTPTPHAIPAAARITPNPDTIGNLKYVLAHAGARVGGLDALNQGWVDSIKADCAKWGISL